MDFQILKYSDGYRVQVLKVWEESVLATHDFLTPADFHAIREAVATIDFNHFDVYCLVNENVVGGFLGVAEKKLEMLFISPELFGRGHGKKLLTFAIEKLHADKVDVNEQNRKAVSFYLKHGFRTYERTNKDDQGRDYPLLRMALEADEI